MRTRQSNRENHGRIRRRMMLALTSIMAVAAVGCFTAAADAQRAVIIIDGEPVTIEFNAVEQLRDEVENIQRGIREQRNRIHIAERVIEPEIDVELPSDEELSRVSVDTELRLLVEDLGSESYETRERATGRLLDASQANVQFYAILAQQDLTSEQRNRLLMVVRQRLIQTPRGAVGISMRPAVRGPDGLAHVEVADLIEGLPAERVLKVGDRITHLDGKPLESTEELTVAVQSRRPGEQIVLNVLRPKRDQQGRLIPNNNGRHDDEELRIELTLGSADQLPSNNARGVNRLSTVEQMRRQKAKLLVQRFAPSPVAVEFDGTPFVMDAIDLDDPRVQQFIARRIDQHPVIQQVLEHRRIIEEGGRPVPDAIRARWEETRMRLEKELGRRDLSPEHRAILERVIDRHEELTKP